MTRSRTVWVTAALMATTLGAAAVPAMAAPAATPHAATACPSGWGSRAKTNGASAAGHSVTNARTGRHDCYDRFVIDVPGAPAGRLGYSVRYVDQLVQDPSGHRIPVSGGAILEVVANAPAYDVDSGTPTYPGHAGKPLPGVNLTGYRTFRDAKFAGSFEGQSQFGLGLRARLPFRVLQKDGHLVVDVAHTW